MNKLLITALALAGCTRAAEDRANSDLDVGFGTAGGVSFQVADHNAHVRRIEPGAIELWAQAPVLSIALAIDSTAAADWTITLGNALPDAILSADLGGVPLPVVDLGGPRPTLRSWQVSLPASGAVTLTIAPADAADLAPWRFVVMGDIQDAMEEVHEVFARIDAEPDIRFVISTGDIVHRGRVDEYNLFEIQLATLDVPFYSTIGNHELWQEPERWRERFGRHNVHFDFRGVTFTLVDSGSATIDPIVHGWIDTWLADAADRIHVFGTHFPPLDPVGARQGGFASASEARRLLARLAAGGVDLTLYGHLHTYTGFSNAGIPAHISGGGGAEPMLWDGIDRHFLTVDVAPAQDSITAVTVVRVD